MSVQSVPRAGAVEAISLCWHDADGSQFCCPACNQWFFVCEQCRPRNAKAGKLRCKPCAYQNTMTTCPECNGIDEHEPHCPFYEKEEE